MRWRIIAYGAAVLAILMAVSLVTMVGFIGPDIQRMQARGSGLMLEGLVLAAPGDRQHQLDQLAAMQVEVSLYEQGSGRLLGTNVNPPLSPETPPSPFLERLTSHGVDAVMRYRGPTPPPPWPMAIPLGAALLALVLLSFPVTAVMTRKLEALAQTARRFGEGDLTERADASGSDEVSLTAQAFNTMAQRIAELRLRERELLANVSHELRTPMARMGVLLELVQSNPAAAQRYVGEFARDLHELEALLDRIIDTFRVDLASPRAREAWPLERRPLDVRDLVSEVADDFRARMPARPVVIELAPEPVVRSVDRTLLRRALMNLLENAAKYSPEGSEIRAVVTAGGEIIVSDRGEGIEAGDLPHVFEPFFRADRSRTRDTGGVGLGLSFVERVAMLHQGRVWVKSQVDEGSQFALWLG